MLNPTSATGTLRRRLIASLLAAALLPFAVAWWIANGYARAEAQDRVDTRLELTIRDGTGRVDEAYGSAQARARALAVNRIVHRALFGGDVATLERVLGPRESATIAGGVAVGELPEGRPAARVLVRARGRTAGTVAVALPAPGALLARLAGSTSGTSDLLAIEQGGRLVYAPAAIRGATLDGGNVDAEDASYRARSASLPFYDPPLRLVALANKGEVANVLGPLQSRLAIAGLLSLVAVVLLALALARPLLRGLGVVELQAEEAEIDPLTRVANRRGFERALALELERTHRYDRPCALVLVDLDDFKAVNDQFGHATGDAVLRTLAAVLRRCTRTVDLPARLGGEEFALLLPETDLAGAIRTAERVRRRLETTTTPVPGGDPIVVTASLGVATGTRDVTSDELLDRADVALYAAKNAGKNRVEADATPVTADDPGTTSATGATSAAA